MICHTAGIEIQQKQSTSVCLTCFFVLIFKKPIRMKSKKASEAGSLWLAYQKEGDILALVKLNYLKQNTKNSDYWNEKKDNKNNANFGSAKTLTLLDSFLKVWNLCVKWSSFQEFIILYRVYVGRFFLEFSSILLVISQQWQTFISLKVSMMYFYW